MIPVASVVALSIQEHLGILPKITTKAIERGPRCHMVEVGDAAVLGVATHVHDWESKVFFDEAAFYRIYIFKVLVLPLQVSSSFGGRNSNGRCVFMTLGLSMLLT